MTVFDVDGTLIGGETTDWECFRAAFEEVAGFTLSESFFASIEEITAKAIVHQALSGLPMDERNQKERAICDRFLRRLEAAHGSYPTCFRATPGAKSLMVEMKQRGAPVAIATGDWRETISFKLRVAGIPFEDIPMVTSSEFYGRAEIIAAAVREAGVPLEQAVYVGDGIWDMRACIKLGISFIGVGHRRENLLQAGASSALEDLSSSEFWEARDALAKPKH